VRTRATLPDPSQGPGESFARVFSCACERVSLLVFPSFSRMVPACSFYSLKEVQGYRMSVRDPCWGSSPGASGGLIRWCRGLHCRGMASVLLALLLHDEACVPLLREWFLSFGIVAMRPVMPGPVAGVAYWSLQFDLA
jgi:hypothetical protein